MTRIEAQLHDLTTTKTIRISAVNGTRKTPVAVLVCENGRWRGRGKRGLRGDIAKALKATVRGLNADPALMSTHRKRVAYTKALQAQLNAPFVYRPQVN